MVKIYQIPLEGCLDEGEKVILAGGILVYPTDTLYGLGVDARSSSAVERLGQVKGRGGPWSVVVCDLNMLNRYARVPEDKKPFVNSHLPGKATLILPARLSDLSPAVMGGRQTVGIRIPRHPFPVDLTRRLGFPITTTSVNRTGQDPLNDPERIARVFGDDVDLIAHVGPLPRSRGSRIYDLTGKKINVVRDSR
ncbi:MAG: L-threonylcarbamoyladenylate synthase [Fidelibacterota bacterium]